MLFEAYDSTFALYHTTVDLGTLATSSFVRSATILDDVSFQGPGALSHAQTSQVMVLLPGSIARFTGGTASLFGVTVRDFTGADAMVFESGTVASLQDCLMYNWNGTGLRDDARAPFITIHSAAQVTTRRVSFYRGRGARAGAVNIFGGGSLTSTDDVYSNCYSNRNGGAVAVEVRGAHVASAVVRARVAVAVATGGVKRWPLTHVCPRFAVVVMVCVPPCARTGL